MKFTDEDIEKMLNVFSALKLADIDSCLISEGQIRGMNEAQNGLILSALEMSFSPELQIGIKRVGELDKRLALFSDKISLECEFSATNAVTARKLNIAAKSGKIDFRCSSASLIVYPKSMQDTPAAVLTLTKEEGALISKAVKTLGTTRIKVVIHKDGRLHFESSDSTNDIFELDAVAPVQFIDAGFSALNKYDTSNSGIFLKLLEHCVRVTEQNVELVLTQAGNMIFNVHGHDIIVVSKIDNDRG